jgi:hypothetical protein
VVLDTVAGVRREMARLYRLGLNGKIESGELTRLVYVLKEVRAAIEAEKLIDIQDRLIMLTRNVENPSGRRIPHPPTFSSN